MKERDAQPVRTFAGNVFYNILSLAAPMIFAFIATPLIIRGLGVEEYGYYSLVLAVIAFGFTTGIGRLPVKYIPEKRAAGDPEGLRTLLSASVAVTLGVAIVEALALVLASPYLISSILQVPDGPAERLQASIYIACFIGSAMMLSQLFQSALQGVHNFRVYAIITTAAAFLMNIGSVLLAVYSYPYFHIFVWNLLVTLAAGTAFLIFAKLQVPELKLQAPIDSAVIRKVGAFAFSIFVYQSITSVFILFERSYILRSFGAEALTYYTIPLMLGMNIHGVVLAVSQVTVPKFNERVFDSPRLMSVYQTLTKIVLAGSLFFALMFYCLGAELLSLWLGADFANRSSTLLLIHGSAFALIALLIPAWILSESARRPGINASSPLVTYVVGMVGIVALGSLFQIDGVAGGRLIGAIAALPIIFVVERLVFDKIMWLMWAAMTVRISAAAFLVLVLDKIVVARLETSWLMFLMSSGLLAFGFWGVLWLLRFIDRAELVAAFTSSSPAAKNAETPNAVQ